MDRLQQQMGRRTAPRTAGAGALGLGISLAGAAPKTPRALAQEATPALAADAYTGAFRAPLYGEIAIAEAGEGLVLRIGPDLTAYPLTHYDRDTFWYQPPGENAFGPSGVTFTLGSGGTAASVEIENLNVHGQGVFARAAAGGV